VLQQNRNSALSNLASIDVLSSFQDQPEGSELMRWKRPTSQPQLAQRCNRPQGQHTCPAPPCYYRSLCIKSG